VRQTLPALALAGLCGLSVGCGGSADQPDKHPDDPATSTTTTSATTTRQAETPTDTGPATLPAGKSDLELAAGTYRSPAGFAPALQVTLTGTGWRSTHRGADGFDLSRPDPTKDAPLVALVVVTPPESDAAAALAGLTARARRAGARVRPGEQMLSGVRARLLDVQRGDGPLVVSREHGIALDAVSDGRSRIVVWEVSGQPVVATVFVPDRTHWSAALRAARPLLSSLTAA
jgi:hypothetical protein